VVEAEAEGNHVKHKKDDGVVDIPCIIDSDIVPVLVGKARRTWLAAWEASPIVRLKRPLQVRFLDPVSWIELCVHHDLSPNQMLTRLLETFFQERDRLLRKQKKEARRG
jgi:hypothetical protein